MPLMIVMEKHLHSFSRIQGLVHHHFVVPVCTIVLIIFGFNFTSCHDMKYTFLWWVPVLDYSYRLHFTIILKAYDKLFWLIYGRFRLVLTYYSESTITFNLSVTHCRTGCSALAHCYCLATYHIISLIIIWYSKPMLLR